MTKKIIAYDLGTGGIKASLFDENGISLTNTFTQYDTYYNADKLHEQKPEDWWNGIVSTTRQIIADSKVDVNDIEALSISGHSLGVVPIDKNGNLLRELTPIWSDTRASEQTNEFFKIISYDDWYMETGNGFPAECYAIFKIMWYMENEPDMYSKIDKVLGSKDYCNYKLTGISITDHSYASGSGVYSLKDRKYRDNFIKASGVEAEKLPDIISSHEIIGTLTEEASKLIGLPKSLKVVCGGVDNSCMALGARGISEGRVYTSLGSSAWIAVTSKNPILDVGYKPFVFAHVIDNMYASATSIFSAGNSFRWVRDNICSDFKDISKNGKQVDEYVTMGKYAEKSPVGSNKLIFNPSLAGGSMIEETPDIRGGYVGLSLSHTRPDLIRASMEGIAFNLRYALDVLKMFNKDISSMLIVGGGSKSEFWRQMFADIYELDILKTNIDQDAASLGAAALAAYGTGIWSDYEILDSIHIVESVKKPIAENSAKYMEMYEIFKKVAHYMAESGNLLVNL